MAEEGDSAFELLDPEVPQPPEPCEPTSEPDVLLSPTDMSDMVLSPSEVVESSDPDHDNTNYATSQKLYSTRANDKGELHRNIQGHRAMIPLTRLAVVTVAIGNEHPLQEVASTETVLTEIEIEVLTLRFLFDDPSGVKATGPNECATRPTLGLVVNSSKVRDRLWAHRKAKIKAVLADELGRFDKQEFFAHIINNALGRPLLPQGKLLRDVGVAADNTINPSR